MCILEVSVYECQEGCCGETLIPITQVCEKKKVKVFECNVKTFNLLFVILTLISISYVESGSCGQCF